MSPAHFLMIFLAEEKPQSARMPTTFGGNSLPAAISTVEAPMEIPVSTSLTSGPNSLRAKSIQERQSLCSLIPKVITLPSLPQLVR